MVGISAANGKIDGLHEKVTDLKNVHVDHEVRIKALELTVATAIAGRAQRLTVWQWVWGAITFVLPLSIVIIDKIIK